MSTFRLTKINPKRIFLLIVFLNVWLSLCNKAFAEEPAILWGKVEADPHQPLAGAKLTATAEEFDIVRTSWSGRNGYFVFCGLPAGAYKIQFEAEKAQGTLDEKVFLEPGQTLCLRILLYLVEGQRSFRVRLSPLDLTTGVSETTLDDEQIKELPSGNTIWSLVENQDFSATTNRIDVGGVWASLPGLFSTRGSSSWTQTTSLLNGLDVSDPYWGGSPLFFPDFFSLGRTQLKNAGLPPQTVSPGGSFDVVPKKGGSGFRGEFNAFYSDKALGSSNITSALQKEGIFETNSINAFKEVNAQFSGPLIPKKLFFFTSWTGFDLSRHIAEYEQADRGSVLSGLVNVEYRIAGHSLHFLWTGQIVHSPSLGAGRQVPFSSTLDQRDYYSVVQATGEFKLQENHFLKAGLSYSRGDLRSQFQEGVSGPHGLEIFQNVPRGPAPVASRDRRESLALSIKGTALWGDFSASQHKLEYGLDVQRRSAASRKEIKDNLHLRFFEGKPLEIIRYNVSPLDEQEKGFAASLFAQDTVTLGDFLAVSGGLNLSYCQGRGVPNAPTDNKNEIRWLNLSPRAGLIVPLSVSKKSALKLSVARYYFSLPLNWLSYGNPNALGGTAYSWNDSNNDGLFEEGEAQMPIRREGPFFAGIDPSIARPYTDELSAGFVQAFGHHWVLSLTGFLRRTANLVETLNTGVPFSSYLPVKIYDSGDDRLPGTPDDLTFTVYDQPRDTLGHDFFLLTNPEAKTRTSHYKGLDFVLYKRFGSGSTFFITLTASEATGTASPGNSEWENDDGIVGSLYDNPNTLINAKGRLRFDRAYTGRLGFSVLGPLGLRFSYLLKYYDGQPFARKIIVKGLNQGPFYIMAHPRGVSRYEFNMTHDIRLEKTVELGSTRLKFIVDGFNIFNQRLATEENEWTGPEYPLRYATEIQSPRVFRLGIAYEF